MDKTVKKGSLPDEILINSSKSEVIRLLFCAALSQNETEIISRGESDDINAAVRCLNELGADIEKTGFGFSVKPVGAANENPVFDCGQSAAVLRFILPAACGFGIKEARFIMGGRLPERPLSPLIESLGKSEVSFEKNGAVLIVRGKADCNAFSVDCSVSSQFASGLLLMLSRTGGRLSLGGERVSAPYLDMTVSALRAFGADITEKDGGYIIASNKLLSPGKVYAGGDWSTAAAYITAGVIGEKPITVKGLDLKSAQGDKIITDILKGAGANIEYSDGAVTAFPSKMTPFEFDAANAPDLVPCLSAAACAASGKSVIYNAARLKTKESDRLEACAAIINALGGKARADEESLTVFGTGLLKGGTVDSFGDHRIVMAAACLAQLCENEVTIQNAGAVSKSCPGFFEG